MKKNISHTCLAAGDKFKKPLYCASCDEEIEEGTGIEPEPGQWLCQECYAELYCNDDGVEYDR